MKTIHVSGKRKSAIARATLNEGNGSVRVNHLMVDVFEPEVCRMKLFEPLLLAGDTVKKVNIDVVVFGGGMTSQAEAARLAIARALSAYDKKLEDVFSKYDRHLLVADVRRKETHKPNRHGKARAKTQKSYR
ncbi:MAG: 30S ribosomal protein S9 [Candidatus Woesearchaeota archaeon]